MLSKDFKLGTKIDWNSLSQPEHKVRRAGRKKKEETEPKVKVKTEPKKKKQDVETVHSSVKIDPEPKQTDTVEIKTYDTSGADDADVPDFLKK